MSDDYQSNYWKGYSGQAGQGPGYHMGQADRAIKRNRDFWEDQQKQQDARRKRDEASRQRYENTRQAAGGVEREPEPGFYEQFPRLATLSNWLALIFFVLGAAAGVAAAMESQHAPSTTIIVITGVIVGLMFAGIGKALPWAFFMALSLAVGLGVLAIGAGLIAGVVYLIYWLIKAAQ